MIPSSRGAEFVFRHLISPCGMSRFRVWLVLLVLRVLLLLQGYFRVHLSWQFRCRFVCIGNYCMILLFGLLVGCSRLVVLWLRSMCWCMRRLCLLFRLGMVFLLCCMCLCSSCMCWVFVLCSLLRILFGCIRSLCPLLSCMVLGRWCCMFRMRCMSSLDGTFRIVC